ncbi:MAG: hypothetical protein Kow0049_12470 [Stanieria sp.]
MMDKMVVMGFLLVAVFPLLLFEIPVILPVIPKKIQKFLCFVPCGTVVFFDIKNLLEHHLGLFFIFLFFSCITLYGAFAMKDIITFKD